MPNPHVRPLPDDCGGRADDRAPDPLAASMPGDDVPAVELRGVSKHFGEVAAVDGIDLTVAPGEVVAFLGPNGAGKTTTIDMMLGLTPPSAGSIHVHGLTPSAAIRRGLISAVLQTGGLLKDFTVGETVAYTAALFPAHRPIADVMERAGIADLASRQVGKCSGGEQQRLRFALALLPEPALLILDEPTQGMDVQARRRFWEQVHAEARTGRTVVFATHYLDEADAFADRIVLLRRGRVVADGTAAQIRSFASGRSVSAHWPDADTAALRALPGAISVTRHGAKVLIQAGDSDAVARYLLTKTTSTEVEITSSNLEDAFVALTTDAPGVESPAGTSGAL